MRATSVYLRKLLRCMMLLFIDNFLRCMMLLFIENFLGEHHKIPSDYFAS